MKNVIYFLAICVMSYTAIAQKKPNKQEKAPTQKEMEDMMKEAQKAMEEMSEEDKRMMDSLGIKMPNFNQLSKDVSGISDESLSDAAENENRIVPKKDLERIAAIPKAIPNNQMLAYILTTNNKAFTLLDVKQKAHAETILKLLRQKSTSAEYLGNAGMGFWMMGYPEIAFYITSKACEQDASNANNLNNYASMLTMLGAAHLAIPILDNINLKFPNNNTILNNIGQAWFQLGDIPKAEKYLKETIALYANHSQANLTMCFIEESKGNIPAAVVAVKKSLKQGNTPKKEAKLKQLGGNPDPKEDHFPQDKKNDALNLGGFNPPPFPISVMECVTLGLQWNEYRGLLNQKIAQLEKEQEKASKEAQKFNEKLQNENLALVQASLKAGMPLDNLISAPIYAKRAERQLNEVVNTYQRKIKDHMVKIKNFAEGNGTEFRNNYEAKMSKSSLRNLVILAS